MRGAITQLDLQLAWKRHTSVAQQGKHLRAWVFNAASSRTAFLALYRDLLYASINWAVGPDVRMVGFKEVRWTPQSLRDSPQFFHQKMALLLEVFPCSKLIINFRSDVDAQSKSDFWQRMQKTPSDLKAVLAILKRANDELKAFTEQHPDNTFLFPTESLSDLQHLQRLINWLGYEECKVTAMPHANNNGTLTRIDPSGMDSCSKEHGCSRTPGYVNQFVRC